MGIRCFPGVESQSQAVIILVEKFILPLLNLLKDERSVQNSFMQRLITLVNSQKIVDFMSDLHVVLNPIYGRYA